VPKKYARESRRKEHLQVTVKACTKLEDSAITINLMISVVLLYEISFPERIDDCRKVISNTRIRERDEVHPLELQSTTRISY